MTEYSGHVEPGGPAAVRDLGSATITKVSVGPMDNNAYLLRCARTGEAILIDAANDPERLLDLVSGSTVRYVVTTHAHGDHWQALTAVSGATEAAVAAHRLDAPALPVPVTAPVGHGDRLDAGDLKVEIIHLRGHTPGSIAVRYDGPDRVHLFTGDSLFPGGVGKSTPETFPTLLADVEQRLFAILDDRTWVYPGHGDDTTLGQERPHLPQWRARGW